MAYNSAYTGAQVDAAVGAVRNKETTWDSKQNALSGTEDQLVGFNASGEAAAVPMPSAADVGADPAGTAEAEVADHNSSEDAHSTLFAEKQDKITGQQGQIVGFDSSGNPIAQTAPDTGVVTFNGRTGAVSPQTGDYTADMVGARPNTWTPSAADVGAVPTSRTVNNKALSADISLTASDVGARPSSWTPTASEVGAVPTSRTVNGKPLSSNISLTADDVGAANPPALRTATLSASRWSGNSQTVTVRGVSATETDQLIQPVPAIASQSAYYAAGILCTGQAANRLTFTCTETPTENLTVYVVIQEVSA